MRSQNENAFFSIITEAACRARLGRLHLGTTKLLTPAFMPVGTLGNVKAIWSEDLDTMGYRLILGNTYHLALRPGAELIARKGGLKKFMGWPHALLTDSGGYQVFSLSERLRFHPEGVEFQSHIDGSRHLFTAPRVVDLQLQLGSDVLMVLDDCPPAHAPEERLRSSLARTHRWAGESLRHFQRLEAPPTPRHLFGIVQGGLHTALRQESLDFIQSLQFSGIALGGLSVGEARSELYTMLAFLGPRLDPKRPRYLMGVGAIPDILEAVKNGIDMFDCVLPTRNARNGQAFTSEGLLRLRNQIHKDSSEPLDENCSCRVCKKLTRAYIRHLFMAGEILGSMALTYHNLFFYNSFMEQLRRSIKEGKYLAFYKHWRGVFM